MAHIRRKLVFSATAATATAVFAAVGISAVQAAGHDTVRWGGAGAVHEETKSLDQLYKEARAEGGTLTVYAGGDVKNQQDDNKKAFEKAFPGIKVNMIVDYSKYHDARIDNQLRTDSLVPDVVQLQTLQDFPRWKHEGALMPYKPAGFSKVYKDFKDRDGYWTAIFSDSFGLVHNTEQVTGNAPRTAKDLLAPQYKGKIISTFPNDDDAVLYNYKQLVDKYGWDWLKKFTEQDVQWVRGAQQPADDVEAAKKSVALGAENAISPYPGQKSRFAVTEGEPFMSWAQRAAIFKDAKHPATAKLYMNWWLSKQQQSSHYQHTVRTDVKPRPGMKHVWEYRNTDLRGFERFMSDRAAVERFKTQLALYVGEPQGAPTPGWLGTHPGRS